MIGASTLVSGLEAATIPISAALRVLVAEDNLTNQRMILGLLCKTGIEVTVVANGRMFGGGDVRVPDETDCAGAASQHGGRLPASRQD